MRCGPKANGRVNRSRLGMLIGTVAMIGAATIYAILVFPGFGVFLPLLLFAALCPASCGIGKVASWVRGGKKVAELRRTG